MLLVKQERFLPGADGEPRYVLKLKPQDPAKKLLTLDTVYVTSARQID
jgi:hypothetical protein